MIQCIAFYEGRIVHHMSFQFSDKFEYESGSLIFPEKEITWETRQGEKISGVFHIISGSDLSAEVTILSESWRISCDRAGGQRRVQSYKDDCTGSDSSRD